MSKRFIHALIAPSQLNLSIIPLTKKYTIQPFKSDYNQLGIFIIKNHDEMVETSEILKGAVDSLTVTFGKNGGGKTQFLLNVCNTVGRHTGTRPLGVLWEESGRLFFDPGSHLRKLELKCETNLVKRGIFDGHDLFGAAFYTTSPFETGRRRNALAGSETLDVTPSFGTENPFGGIALLLAAQALPDDLEFIKKMEVQPKLKIPSLRSLTEFYTGITRRAGSPSQPKFIELSDQHKNIIRNLPLQLNDHLSKTLAIEMHRARLEGKEQAASLLADLRAEFLEYDADIPFNEFLHIGGTAGIKPVMGHKPKSNNDLALI